ncbi:MAG: transporter [bacterium]
MNRYRVIIVSATLLTAAVLSISAGMSSAAEIKARSGFFFDWFTGSGHSHAWQRAAEATKGYQFSIPVKIELDFQKFSAGILAGAARTQFNLAQGEKIYMTNTLDTRLNLAYPITDQLPVDILLGLDLNLPTGRTDLKEKELVFIGNPDIVSITNFGEGLNINPTVSLAKEWTSWAAGLGLGYVFRGKYDYCETVRDYDPGDIVNLTTQVNYNFLTSYQARLFADYAYFTKDTKRGKDSFQEGNFLRLGFGLNYSQTRWDAQASLQSILRGKSKSIEEEPAPAFTTEDKNRHGDEWIAGISGRYSLNDQTSLKSQMEFLWADENDYLRTDPLYLGKKQKLSLGAGAGWQITSRLDADAMLKGFLLKNNDRDYQGASLIARLIASF